MASSLVALCLSGLAANPASAADVGPPTQVTVFTTADSVTVHFACGWDPTCANPPSGAETRVEIQPIHKYHTDGAQTCHANDASCTFSNLTTGLDYSVSARTMVSDKQVGDAVVVPEVTPHLPVTIHMDIGTTEIKLWWDPVSFDGKKMFYQAWAMSSSRVGGTCTYPAADRFEVGVRGSQGVGTLGTSCVISDLQPGESYNLSVTANAFGLDHPYFGLPHRPVAWTKKEWVSLCCQVPQSPTDLKVADIGAGSIQVAWSPPASFGGANTLTYDVTTTPASAGCSTTSLECTIPNFKFSTPYTFQVTARNSAGSSGPTSTLTPLTLVPPRPGEPTAIKVSMSGHTAQVNWKAPTDAKKLTVTSYKVTSSPGGKSCVSKKTSCSISGLSFGTKYRFTVRAFRGTVASGLSHASIPVSYSPPPPAPALALVVDPKPAAVLS